MFSDNIKYRWIGEIPKGKWLYKSRNILKIHPFQYALKIQSEIGEGFIHFDFNNKMLTSIADVDILMLPVTDKDGQTVKMIGKNTPETAKGQIFEKDWINLYQQEKGKLEFITFQLVYNYKHDVYYVNKPPGVDIELKAVLWHIIHYDRFNKRDKIPVPNRRKYTFDITYDTTCKFVTVKHNCCSENFKTGVIVRLFENFDKYEVQYYDENDINIAKKNL